MLTVTTDLDMNRNESIRTPLRANDMGKKCLALPRTGLEADFLEGEANSKTHRWPGVTPRIKNIPRLVLGTTYGLRKQGSKERHRSGDSIFSGLRVSITSFERVWL